MIRWVLLIGYLILTIYGFQAVKTITKSSWAHYLYIAIALLILGNFIFRFVNFLDGRWTCLVPYF